MMTSSKSLFEVMAAIALSGTKFKKIWKIEPSKRVAAAVAGQVGVDVRRLAGDQEAAVSASLQAVVAEDDRLLQRGPDG